MCGLNINNRRMQRPIGSSNPFNPFNCLLKLLLNNLVTQTSINLCDTQTAMPQKLSQRFNGDALVA